MGSSFSRIVLDGEINGYAPEQGSYVFDVSFFDDADQAVTPNSDLVWTLTDLLGTVINNKSEQSLTPAETVTISLEGDDLILSDDLLGYKRLVTLEATYENSSGSTLRMKVEVLFEIENLVKVV